MRRAFLGSGVLAIWNGIESEFEAEFLRWHVGEHIPERLSIPGFLRARRYVVLEGQPAYFNFYEVAKPEVLSSEPYLARLNDPSQWSRRVVPHFTDTSRSLCRVVESRGDGVAGAVFAIRVEAPAQALLPLLDPLADSPDTSGVHLLERFEAPTSATAESAMRSRPDEASQTILLVEGPSPALLAAALGELAADVTFERACGTTPAHRGLYQLDFLMDAPHGVRTVTEAPR